MTVSGGTKTGGCVRPDIGALGKLPAAGSEESRFPRPGRFQRRSVFPAEISSSGGDGTSFSGPASRHSSATVITSSLVDFPRMLRAHARSSPRSIASKISKLGSMCPLRSTLDTAAIVSP